MRICVNAAPPLLKGCLVVCAFGYNSSLWICSNEVFHDLSQHSAINPNKYGEAPPLPSTPLKLRSNSNSLFSRTPHKNLSKTAWWKRLTRSSYSFVLLIAPSNHYCNEGIRRLHCTGKSTLLFEEVKPPVMQKKSSTLTINKRMRGFVHHVSIQTSLSCICIYIWILFTSYKYKRHSRVIWWGPLPLAMCRLLRLVSSTNHDHRTSHPCKRLFKHSARHDVDSCFSYPC